MLIDTPEIVEADRVTGYDCFLAKVVVRDAHELETVIDRFQPSSSTDTAIIQSSTVVHRLPKLQAVLRRTAASGPVQRISPAVLFWKE